MGKKIKLTEGQLKQIIKEAVSKKLHEASILDNSSLDEHDVAKLIIANWISGRNAPPMTPENILSALGGPSAKEYFERYGVTYEQMKKYIGWALEDIVKFIRAQTQVPGGMEVFRFYDKDWDGRRVTVDKSRIWKFTLTDDGKLDLDM